MRAAGVVIAVAMLAMAGGATAADTSPDQRVIRSWADTVGSGTDRAERRVDIVFDYRRGLAYEQIYDVEGQLLSSRIMDRSPSPSDDELAAAIAIVEADGALNAVVDAHQAVLEGGFILSEPAGRLCGPKTRCLQIFAFEPDAGEFPVFRAVVDLTRDKIIYRDFWNRGNQQGGAR